jgi:phosphatidylserine decarboxylase
MAVPRALRSPIAPQAWPISAALAALALLLAGYGHVALAALALLAAAANAAFFRNPKRSVPEDPRAVVSPADGRVVEVAEVEDPEGFVGKAWRIAIFLSVFDVHVNRAPLAAAVRAVRRGGTRFLAAFRPEASGANVRLRLDLETPGGLRAALVQITGLIARRIVCYANEGDPLVRGEPYGLICYGSRVELYLPVSSRIRVQAGDRVRGGESVLAEVVA